MRLFEALRVAASGLLANRLRAALTMLGIIIGVASVIALVSFGQGYQKYVEARFQSMGSNLVMVFPSSPRGNNARNIKSKPLTIADAQAIANPANVPDVTTVAPEYSVATTLVANGNSVSMSVTGVIPAWTEVRNWPVSSGRFIDNTDLSSYAPVVVLGVTAVEKLFDPGVDPVGEIVRINNIPFHVIGVLTLKGGFGNADQIALVPLTTAQIRLGDANARATDGTYRVSMIYVQTDGNQSATPVTNAITQLLSERHQVQYVGEEDFRVFAQDQILNTIDNVTNQLTLFLAVIAGISLVVGGIGVMNIMLVSVTERTREIGLRKAVGARGLDLMLQFLLESIAISVSGGVVGILVGKLVALIIERVVPNLTLTLTPPSILLAVGVSIAIGVFFGVYPARRAALLNPIQALRYE